MTQSKIFEILLQKPHDFPKLHVEDASTIAQSFADIIYDTLQVKSTVAATKRLNVLRFLQRLTPDNHIGVEEQNCSFFINACVPQIDNTIEKFVNEIQSELKYDLCEEIREFNKKKNETHRENVKKLELIRKHDQEALDHANFPARVAKNISYYETSDKIIISLFKNDPEKIQNGVVTSNVGYRRKQIKFAYALLHLHKWASLEKILQRLHKYDNLALQEINFLVYFNENVAPEGSYLRQTLIKNFMFIYEKTVIDACIDIILCEDNKALESVKAQKNMTIIKQLCHDPSFRLKLQEILFQLYAYSFCNSDLLKLLDFFYE